MTRVEEYIFLMDVLLDLKSNYPDHNSSVLEELIALIKYRLDADNK